MKYIAFLRGINLGPKNKIAMSALKDALLKGGFTGVKTLLNSGNVVVETSDSNAEKVKKEIEAVIKKDFGLDIHTIIRTQKHLHDLIQKNPFKKVSVTPDIRLYVLFLSEKPTSTLKIPYVSAEKDFHILEVTDTEVICYLDLSKGKGTIEVMNILAKEFGKNTTMRNWNTLVKAASL